MTSVDRILELIDSGLGESFESGYEGDDRSYCWRCQDRPATARFDGACEACSAWLLGEGEDPIGEVVLRSPLYEAMERHRDALRVLVFPGDP